MNKQEKKEKIEELNQTIKTCEKCPLYKTRTNSVPGEGSINPKIMFIGEAPGFNEDIQGKPFVGQAGKIFDKLLNFINLKRNEIYITNIIKCRPPKNRNPSEKEIETCSHYLEKQIGILNPKTICCLGNFSMKFILNKYGLKNKIQGISKIHGKIFKISTLNGTLNIIPLYHPAVATYNSNMLETLKHDFKILEIEKR